MLKFICSLFALAAGFLNALAQTQTLNVTNNATGPQFVRFNDPSGLINSKAALEYEDISGTCFWNKEWSPALLTIKNGTGYKLQKVKMNFYTNDVHYIDKNGSELVAVPGNVKKIVFYDRKDTSKITGVFQELSSFVPKPVYGLILTDGKIQFIKITTAVLKKDDYNPMIGKDTFHFSSSTKYFLSENSVLAQLKGLGKKSILSVIKSTDEIEAWLKSNRNDLKGEKDIIAFLEYYNSSVK